MVTNGNCLVKHRVTATTARLFWLHLLMIASVAPCVADSELQDWMTPPEMDSMGLHSLSQGQQAALAEWIKAKIESIESAAIQAGGPSNTQGRSAKTDDVIKAQIVGQVTTWSGDARFKLNNNQVWAQRGSERGSAKLSSPEVSIEKNFLGFYVMTLVPSGQKIRVKRVE